MTRKQIPSEAIINLRRRLEVLPSRCRERRLIVEEMAATYGVSVDTLYRALRERARPSSAHRLDKGQPRKLPRSEMERYCEIIAACKIRTCRGRKVGTSRRYELSNCSKNTVWKRQTGWLNHQRDC